MTSSTKASAKQRVITLSPMPPEKCAFALARYSRSPDSIRDSVEWVRTHDSTKFLESFYFQYGHASIADLGHVVLCFEGISELAATEIEDEQLWDGQARSSRYQDFSRSGFVTPPEFDAAQSAVYQEAAKRVADRLQPDSRQSLRLSRWHIAASGRDESGSVSTECQSAGFRRSALPVVLWHPNRCRTSNQHSNTRAAGAPVEGFRVSRVTRVGGRNCGGLRRAAELALG